MAEMEPTLDATALEIKRLAEQAQAELDALIAANGTATASQVLAIQNRFNAAYVQAMAKSMGNITGDPWDVRMVKDMPVSGLKLADKLYLNAHQTANEVSHLISEHAKGHMQARELAIRLYDGYNPKDGIVRPLEGAARSKLPKPLRQLTANPADRAALQQIYDQGQRYAASLKTEPLKAAYLQALEVWKKGKGDAPLQRALERAHKEKTRYMANRIAQTELARAHQDAVAVEFMADESIEVVQVVMSAAHPRVDICDLHARANLYGLGPGCYPKPKAPKPIYHPHCRCRLRSRPDLSASMATEKPNAEAAYLRSLGPVDGSRVMGSRERYEKMLKGSKLDDVVNATTDPYYKMVRLGDLPKVAPVVPVVVPPVVPKTVTTFQEQKTVKDAAKWALNNNLADFADYTGIKPEVANAWNRSLFDHLQEFPELRKDMKFTGTGQAQFARYREFEIERLILRMRAANPNSSGLDFRKIAEQRVSVKKVGNQFAHFWAQQDVRGITVNKKFGADPVNFEKSLQKCVSQGHFPPSNNSFKSVADHEMGHALDHHLGLRVDSDVIQVYKEAKLKGIKNEVSGYAATNIEEFIAECWAESRNSSAPREFAQKIANIVKARYGAKYP